MNVLTARKAGGSVLMSERGIALVAAFILLLPSLYVAKLWLDPNEAWLHPELYGSSEYIWNRTDESLGAKLRKALDWKAFDPNVNRVRPLSDAGDTVDTIARPYITAVFGPRASISPVALVTAILSPVLLFLALRLIGLGVLPAAALTAVFISSTGFLSVLIAYIRPAKKITIVTFCAALYFCQRHDRTRGTGSFLAFITTLFLSFFADEMDLVKYPVFALLYPMSLLLHTSWWKRVLFLSLPILFLVMTVWGLPFLYERFSVHGSWNAFGDSKKLEVLTQLLKPYFYVAWLIHTATAVMTTLGIAIQMPVTIGGTLLVLVAIPVLAILRRLGTPSARYRLAASTAALFMAGFYTTLLDWYPFPDAVSYLGVFTYYYHSSLVVLVILWLAFVWLVVAPSVQSASAIARPVQLAALAATIVVVVASFTLFQRVNLLVQYIHTVPYTSASMFDRLRALAPQLSSDVDPDEPVVVDFSREVARMSESYDATLRDLFGSQWQATTFYGLFQGIKSTPIMREENLGHLVHAYYPRARFVVQVHDGQRVAVTLDAGTPVVADAVNFTATSERPAQEIADNALVLDARAGTLTRERKGEHVQVFDAAEGQRITVRNVGAWDAETRQLSGLPAEFRGGRWRLLSSPESSLTAPFDLVTGRPRRLPTGYDLSPGSSNVSIVRLSDDDGPFLRVTAERDFPSLVVVAGGPLQATAGSPLTARAQIRYRGAGGAQVHLQQSDERGVPTAATTRASRPDRWMTLAAISSASAPPQPNDLFFAGVFDVKRGGSFDLRDFSVAAGVFP